MTVKEFYHSRKWEKFVANLKMQRVAEDGVLYCEDCGKPITKAYDCIGHHEIELTEDNVNDWTVSLNPDNVKLIHFKCHNIRHDRFTSGIWKQQVFLVYGSPRAGKTTFVREHAGKNDLIVDVDRIWEAVTLTGEKRKTMLPNVLKIRDELISEISMRYGRWTRAYIIGGYPLQPERERIADLVGARIIYIDTDRETCLSRARSEDEEEIIERWFESHT